MCRTACSTVFLAAGFGHVERGGREVMKMHNGVGVKCAVLTEAVLTARALGKSGKYQRQAARTLYAVCVMLLQRQHYRILYISERV